ncbi:MAG: TonB-dependent receptor [Pyrinomonadaceae bacterium]|nr:TonB-dependent receptor [Pyrinomonadaceae bacterium]
MTKNHLLMLATILLLSLTYIPQQIQAQAVYGSLSGVVTDSSGAVITDATVTITSVERKTVDTVMTNSDGYYQKDRLLPGTYTIKVEKQGYKSGVTNDITVSVDTQTKNDISLTAGDVAEVVTIEADGQLLKTDRADIATTFSTRQVSELPILDRNFTKLILLTPGTQQQLWNHAASENPQGSTQTIVNGQTFSGTGYQLDGTDNRDVILGIIVINPTFDSVGETKITSSNYDAEFGQAIAGVASVQTKSGTNSFRGSVFEYLQRDRFQARNPFSQSTKNSLTGKFIPDTKRDQFGGSIGGPIIKNRFFFFGDYQGTRATQGGSKLLTVPTALARTGNLSEYGVPIYNPTTNAQYAGNIIPVCGAGQTPQANGCLSQQAIKVLTLMPTPNRAGVVDNFVAAGSETFNNDIFNIRIDSRLSERLNIFGRFSRAKFSLLGPTSFGSGGGPELVSLGGASKTRNISLATGFDYTLSPTTVVDLRFGFFNYKVNVLPFDYGTKPATDAGIPGLNFDDFSSGLFAGFITVNNAGSQGNRDFNFGSGLGVNRCNCPLDQDEKQYQVVTNLTKVYGNHTFKFGVDVRKAFNLRVPSDSHRSGELSFSRDRTAQIVGGLPVAGTGNGLATFLIGDVTSFKRYVSTSVDARESQWRHFYYGQDTWKVTPKLTLALGLRADVFNPQKLNAPGNGGFPNLETGKIDVAGIGDIDLQGNIKNKVNLAPRLGVAYQINDKMVLRGGFGRSFDTGVFGTIFGHTVTQNLPVLALQNLDNGSTNRVFNLSSGPAAPTGFFGITTLPKNCPATGCINNTSIPTTGSFFLPDGITVRTLAPQQTVPQVDAYNVTFQWEFMKNFSFEGAYVGNKGTNVFVGDNPDLNINQPTIVGFGTLSRNARKPYFQKFGWSQDILLYQGYGATNRYDSMQLKLTKRFADGYSFLTHYTLQKAVNNAGEYFNIDPSINRGRADFERTHNFVFTQLYELPFGRKHKYFSGISRLADAFVGGWQINSNTTIQSGFHFNVTYDGAGADRDTGPNRPNVNGAIKYTPGVNGTIDTSVFSKPAVGTFGNLERNALTGPGYWRTDASMLKKFFFNETMNLEFRVEVVNLFNTVNLGNPDGNIGSFSGPGGALVKNANVGKSNSTAFFGNDPQRNLQFAFRFNF